MPKKPCEVTWLTGICDLGAAYVEGSAAGCSTFGGRTVSRTVCVAENANEPQGRSGVRLDTGRSWLFVRAVVICYGLLRFRRGTRPRSARVRRAWRLVGVATLGDVVAEGRHALGHALQPQ